MLSILSDVTERKRAAEMLRTQELELRQREQLDAIGKLAGGIAHDFNNLLTAIHGQALFALEDIGSDDPRALNVEPIVDAAKRASSLTRQLLAFGRRQVLEARVLSLNAVVESIEPLLRRLAGEGIDVTTRSATTSARSRPIPRSSIRCSSISSRMRATRCRAGARS